VKYNDKGAEVARLQRKLIAEGYTLPRWGADGHLGDESWEALERFARDNELLWNPAVPGRVLDALLATDAPVIEVPPTLPPAVEVATVKCYDLRSEQDDPHPKSKTSGGRTVRRAVRAVTGVTIHQTAVEYGVAQYQINAAGGDEELALARRSLKVACHAMAFRRGFYTLSAPLDWLIYHGNGFNDTTLGLEIDGNYPGLRGGTTWNGKPATTLSDETVLAARAALYALVHEGRSLGMPITQLYAHRQSSKTRRSDPGQELWEAVVLDYAVPELGLVLDQSRVLRDGYPVPVEWDPDGKGSY
jgi:hypothetical protein